MRKSSQLGDGVPEVKMECFRGFLPRVHELCEGGFIMEWKDKIGSFRQIDVRGIQGNFF